jgi:hypothetical protein
MAFKIKTYTDELGFFWLCKVSSEFDSTTNVTQTATTAKNVGVHVKISKSNNGFGVRPRHIVIENKTGTPKKRHKVPVYTKAVFDAMVVGADFTAQQLPDGTGGSVYTILAKKGEKRDSS